MNLEQALKKVERESRMVEKFTAPIKDSLAKQDAELKRKRIEDMDDHEFATAIGRGLIR